MDRYDLRARIEAATIRWRDEAEQPAASSARATHARLLSFIDAPGGSKSKHQLSVSDTRKIVAELRTIMTIQTDRASNALRDLDESACRFEYEQENMGGERHLVNLRMREIPYLDNVRIALPLLNTFVALPHAQQENLVRVLDEEKSVRHLEVRLQIEQEDGTRLGKTQRSLTLASAQAALNRALAEIKPSGQEWLTKHREKLNLLSWSNFNLPILSTTCFSPEQLLQASEVLLQISDCLITPFPFDPDAVPMLRNRWRGRWAVCEEAAESLSMVCAWLRCLGSTGEYRRCLVCFRHLGEGMKKNCWLHHRTAKIRVPSRELHVSDLYQVGWKHAAEHHPEIRALLDDPAPTEEIEALMSLAAQNERLSPEVTRAAAKLASALRTLFPLMEPRLQARIKRQFDESVAEAAKLHIARRRVNGETSITPPGQVLNGLSWERFFGNFFASAMTNAEATRFGVGKMIDIDHPLASTNKTITVQKLAMDLLHMGIWVAVDMAFDAYGYLDVPSVRRTLKRAAQRGDARPSYQSLAEAHNTTAQAIHQALSNSLAGRRRYRVLNQGRAKLKQRLTKRRSGNS